MRAFIVCGDVAGTAQAQDLLLRPDVNLNTGVKQFESVFGPTSSLERDLLTLASAIHAYDIAHKRGMREDINRDMVMAIPVVNYHALNGQKARLERFLNVLSDDNWTLTFERTAGEVEPMIQWPHSSGRTLLFSGGLDSLAAAVDLLDEFGPSGIQLASHITGNSSTITSQRKLHTYLAEKYGGAIQRVEVRTGGKDTDELEYPKDNPEVSQRTRSFLFLTIAALAARRRGMSDVVFIAENGQMAIHLPLSAGRIGAFSTHTAHPEFVTSVAEFFTEVLDYEIRVENPFLYRTKAEVVAKLANDHQEAIPVSNSCWRSSHHFGKHCGSCVPCYIRRIALEYHGVSVDPWIVDMFAADLSGLDYDHEGKRNLTELGSFAHAFRSLSDSQIDFEYPEVYSDHFDRDKAIAMYRRFSNEAGVVISRYAGLGCLMR